MKGAACEALYNRLGGILYPLWALQRAWEVTKAGFLKNCSGSCTEEEFWMREGDTQGGQKSYFQWPGKRTVGLNEDRGCGRGKEGKWSLPL